MARGRAPAPRNAAAIGQLLGHLLGTDPNGSHVVARGPLVEGFATSCQRGDTWFLSFLFVAPGSQGRGLGRRLLEACLPSGASRMRLATCVEADQPIATSLYARQGMAPRTPLYLLTGSPDRSELPGCPRGLGVVPLDVALADGIDEELLGYARRRDHSMLEGTGRHGWLVRTASGRVLGYGYTQASGRIGPVAALDPRDLPLLLACLLDAEPAPGARQVVVPGLASAALPTLLRAGMRIDGVPAILSATWPGPALDRYLPISFALL